EGSHRDRPVTGSRRSSLAELVAATAVLLAVDLTARVSLGEDALGALERRWVAMTAPEGHEADDERGHDDPEERNERPQEPPAIATILEAGTRRRQLQGRDQVHACCLLVRCRGGPSMRAG